MKATRVIAGAICFNSASILPKIETSNIVKPVMLPPGRARLVAQPTRRGSLAPGMTMGIERESCSNTGMTRPPVARMTSGFAAIRLAASAHNAVHVVGSPSLVKLHVYAIRPSEFCELLPERPDADAHFGIVLGIRHQNPDAPHLLALLRARR